MMPLRRCSFSLMLLLPLLPGLLPPAVADTFMAALDTTLPEHSPQAPPTRQPAPGQPPVQTLKMADEATVPSLPALLARALAYDAGLESQRLRARAQGKEVPKAWAALLPRLDVTYARSYTDSDNYYSEGGSVSCSNNPRTGALIGGEDLEMRCRGYSADTRRQLTLSQTLFSLEQFRQVQKADAQRDAAVLQVAVAERDLALETAEAYMNALFASRHIALLDGKRTALTLQVTQAQRAYELGIGDRIDLLAARARRDQSEADRVAARNDYDDALSTLTRLTGTIPDFTRFSLNALTDVEFADAPALATLTPLIADNPEVQLAQLQGRIAAAEHDVRQAGYAPEVSLSLSWSDQNSDDPYQDRTDRRVALQAQMNLFQGGYTLADTRQGELLARASRFEAQDARRRALEQLTTRHRRISSDISRLKALRRAIYSSTLYLDAADKGAALGLRDLVDVLDARAEVFQQRIHFMEAFRQLVMDHLHLQAAMGRLNTRALGEVMVLIGDVVEAPRK
ncbi:TolC family protein [Larsenimonas rhizosphaerae]|uniref:TolC family protein n=1 Tax=Larsenimonas rhizosphaerae TaxID=2944682 RepID=A0AA41ZE07_9GAMM|nr:TolC family protein [Larsenimonas rhizosphaerae]MCX2522745.1 TolC family protein [Larsenimonas rhizosphaerae]